MKKFHSNILTQVSTRPRVRFTMRCTINTSGNSLILSRTLRLVKTLSLFKFMVILLVLVLSIVTAEDDVERRMESAISHLKHVILGLSTGRASAALLDPIKVVVYNEVMKINRLGTISAPDPKLITVQVWDESNVKIVEKAIMTAGLGLNPSSDGKLIRVPIPPLTEERRRELSKKASDYGENAKVAIRNLRREAVDILKKKEKNKEISEDECKNGVDDAQKKTDTYITQIDQIIKQKIDEIMGRLT